jgi:hypothetical protein
MDLVYFIVGTAAFVTLCLLFWSVVRGGTRKR